MSDYDAAAAAWADGPAAVYARFAAAMLEHSPVPVSGATVLDVGAGTAVASDAALAAGASRAVATDVAEQMLRRRNRPTSAVLADAARLPFGDAAFDLVMGAFCLGHLPDPGRALTEWRRVGAAVVATAFASGPPHPAKTAVDEAAARFGFVSPPWYERLKKDREPQVEDAERLTALARSAGYGDVDVTGLTVDAGTRTPAEIVGWRWGMAHLAPFVDGLEASRRAEARRVAEDAVEGLAPVLVDVLVLGASS